jgi:hypothetical protein
MNTPTDNTNSGNLYGKSSIILPFCALTASILLLWFLVLIANGSEGRFWATVIGLILGEGIVIIVAIIGFGLALVSLKKEQYPWLAWTGLILNLIFLALMIYFLPLSLPNLTDC